MPKVFRNFFREINSLSSRALNYSLLTVMSQLLLTPITIIMITTKLSPAEQGYYYTFLSLISLQSFFELGFFTYVLNKSSAIFAGTEEFNIQFMVSSEAVKLELGMLYKITKKLYFVISISFSLLIGSAGLIFFSSSKFLAPDQVQWAWIVLSSFCAINLFYLGFNSFLEGCGQIEKVAKFKLIAFISSSMLLIISLYFELGLMSLSLSFLPRILKDIYLVHFAFGKEFRLLARAKKMAGFSFISDVAPMQFRLAISGIFSFMQYSAMVPIVFVVLGPTQAGIIGVGLQLTSFVQQILTRWTHIQQPRMAKLVSIQKYTELNALVKTIQIVKIKLSVIMILSFILVFTLLEFLDLQILDRVPNFWIILMFLVAASAYGQVSIRVGYLRAFVEERAHVMSMAIAVINVVVCYTLLKFIGLYAVSFSYLLSMLFAALPWSELLVRKKRVSLN